METVRDQKFYIAKLYSYAGRFKELFRLKQYPQAKYLYDTALRVAAFLEVPAETIEKLFGYKEESRLDDEEFEELFPVWMVKRCYEVCTIQLYQGYEHESYRRYGQAPQYYPQPRYPVREMSATNREGAEEARRLLNTAEHKDERREGHIQDERGQAG